MRGNPKQVVAINNTWKFLELSFRWSLYHIIYWYDGKIPFGSCKGRGPWNPWCVTRPKNLKDTCTKFSPRLVPILFPVSIFSRTGRGRDPNQHQNFDKKLWGRYMRKGYKLWYFCKDLVGSLGTETKNFRNWFQDIFWRLVPRLFFVPNFSETGSITIKMKKFCEMEVLGHGRHSVADKEI